MGSRYSHLGGFAIRFQAGLPRHAGWSAQKNVECRRDYCQAGGSKCDVVGNAVPWVFNPFKTDEV